MMIDNIILDVQELSQTMNWLNWLCTWITIGWLCVRI